MQSEKEEAKQSAKEGTKQTTEKEAVDKLKLLQTFFEELPSHLKDEVKQMYAKLGTMALADLINSSTLHYDLSLPIVKN